MKCNEFNNQLASLADINSPATKMQQHMEICSSCREAYAKSQVLFDIIAQEKTEKVTPFINTRIMAQIEKTEKKSWMARPALISVISAALLVLGFISASIFTNQNQVISNPAEVIASDYYFIDNAGSQLEEIWLNSYQYE
jgi:predicted anti-sigma-YlaC factor YlaD